MRALLFVFAIFAIVLGVADAREDRVARLKRQLLSPRAAFNGPTTITTTRTAETFAGTVLETCTITLTPVNVNGQDLVRQEKTCKVELMRSSSSLPAATPAPATPSATATSTVVVTETAGAGSSSGTVARPVSTMIVTVTATGQPPVSTSAAAGAPAASTSSASTSSALAEQTSATPTASASGTVTTPAATSSPVATSPSEATNSLTTPTAPAGGPAKEIGTQTKSGSSLPPASTTPSASAAPDQAASSTSALSVSATPAQAEASPSTTQFTLPGKKLEVLPIGLGVFAGISVIALIVVGLVTYERTKYRKAFRQRKLAEQGAGMGYNGMSERV